MSWFGNDPAAELDIKIEEATSESIPNGEMDMAVAMEITDVIRSKKVPPKQAMRGIKKRMTKVYSNPNTLAAVLKLTDVCVKNGGLHFLAEINSKEFIDYLVDYIFKVHYDVKKFKVYSLGAHHAIGTQILRLVKEWSLYFQDQQQGNYLGKVYGSLTNQGYQFPEVDTAIAGIGNVLNFVDSETPPDWIDGPECMICYNPFSVMNRKHHCRACGGVFCQTHSGKSMPLVSLGIMQPVRVCDSCYEKNRADDGRTNADRGDRLLENGTSRAAHAAGASGADEDEQLRKAIELSLQDAGVPVAYKSVRPASPPPGYNSGQGAPPAGSTEEDDEDMKAAIAASLAEYKQEQGIRNQPITNEPVSNNLHSGTFARLPPENEVDFYLNIMPVNVGVYLEPSGQSHGASFGSGPVNGSSTNPFSQTTEANSQGHIAQQKTQQKQQGLQPNHTANVQAHPPVEDLTSQEEEDINLFVQLMGGIKNDPSKEANILYDQNLGELHGRVVRLKPKLNRALRASIEKYEFFLEMNNKINSITRLYDQFLDLKLNQVYSKHTVESPTYGGVQQDVTGQYSQNFFPGTNQNANIPQHSAQIERQTTGHSALPYQPTAPQVAPNSLPAVSYQLTGPPQVPYQPTGPLPEVTSSANRTGDLAHNNVNQPQSYGNSSVPLTDGRENVSKRRDSRSSAPYPAGPDIDADYNYYHQSDNWTQSQNPGQSDDSTPQMPVYPAVPSSPPLDAEDEDKEEASDAESVSSRYPALEDRFDETEEEVQNGGPREHASTRFPLLKDLDLPELKRLTTSESKKFKAEPEPLIEL